MKRLAKEAYPDPTLRTEYMASFGFFTNVTSFTFALFGTSYLLRNFGLTLSLLLYPLCVLVSLVIHLINLRAISFSFILDLERSRPSGWCDKYLQTKSYKSSVQELTAWCGCDRVLCPKRQKPRNPQMGSLNPIIVEMLPFLASLSHAPLLFPKEKGVGQAAFILQSDVPFVCEVRL